MTDENELPPKVQEFFESIKPGTWAQPDPKKISKQDFQFFKGNNEMERLMHLFQYSSNRDLVVTSVGMLEKKLNTLLSQFFVAGTEVELLGEDSRQGTIKDLGLKIILAYAMGLIAKDEKIEFEKLKNIRNRFAHDSELMHFEHDSRVMGYCNSIHVNVTNGNASDMAPRMRYYAGATCMLKCIENRIKKSAGEKRVSP